MKVEFIEEYKRIRDKHNKVVLLQSGGLDSVVCCSMLNELGFEVYNLFIDYDQNALEKEKECAYNISNYYGNHIEEVKLNIPFFRDLDMTNNKVKEYDMKNLEENKLDPSLYVPLRNHLFLSVAGCMAEKYEIQNICIAINGTSDIFGRPNSGMVDAHKKFADKVEKSLNEGSVMYHHKREYFRILTPLIARHKYEVIEIGDMFNCPFEYSWSCHNNFDKPCGKCAGCKSRILGFKESEFIDPAIKE